MIQNDIKNKNIEQIAVTTYNNIDDDIKELLKYKDDILNIIKQYQNNSTTTDMIIDTSIIQVAKYKIIILKYTKM